MKQHRLWAIISLLAAATLACSLLSGGGGATGTASTPTAGGQAGGGGQTGGEAPAGGRSASVSELQNEVEAQETEADAWDAAAEGEAIQVGGGVKTEAEARARLDLSDGTVIRVAPLTEFRLLELSPETADPVTRLLLEAGKLFVRVTQALGGGSFEIETPSGVAAVRGSLLSVNYSPLDGRLIVTCLEGECRIWDAARQTFVDLRDGERSEIQGPAGLPLPPRLMDDADLADWLDNFPGLENTVERLRQRRLQTPSAPAPGSGASGSSGQTACDHPYFPLRPGATWTYLADDGTTSTWTVDSVTGDQEKASASMTFSTGEVTVNWTWECRPDGIVSYEFGSLFTSELGSFGSMSAANATGSWLPPEDQLEVGYAWTNSFELEMEMTLPGLDQAMGATSSNVENLEVTGMDPVTLEGQQYDGLQISRNGTTKITFLLPIDIPGMELSFEGTMELARGVGLVSMTSTTDGISTSSTLVSFSVP